MKSKIILNVIPILFTIITAFVVSSFWSKIALHFDNPEEVIGFYSLNNHHYLNDTLRFVSFIFFPLILMGIVFHPNLFSLSVKN